MIHIEPAARGSVVQRIIVIAHRIDKAQILCLTARQDAPISDALHFRLIHMAAVRHRLDELVVNVIDHGLQHFTLFAGHRAVHGEDILVRAALDLIILDTDLIHQVFDIGIVHVDANAARHGGRRGENVISLARQPVSCRGAHVAHGDHDGLLAAADLIHFFCDLLGRSGRATRAVDADQNGFGLRILSGFLKLSHDFLRRRIGRATQHRVRLRPAVDRAVDADNGYIALSPLFFFCFPKGCAAHRERRCKEQDCEKQDPFSFGLYRHRNRPFM